MLCRVGEGPQSERFLERTFKKAPLKPPTTVHVVAVNPSTVRVTWRYVAPSIEEEPLIGYKVRRFRQDPPLIVEWKFCYLSVLERFLWLHPMFIR